MNLIDIEDALQARLNADGFDACAKPLPASFSMPHVTVDCLNVQPDNRAQAVYAVDLDVRAGDYATAAAEANRVAEWLATLPGTVLGGVPCYALDGWNVQRAQPDASNQGVVMATVSASLRLRVAD